MKKTLLAFLILSSVVLFAQPNIETAELIIKQAESKYPNNYIMQKFHIESQIEALLEINKIKEELNKYKAEAEKEKNR